jgi:putative nucleotidyltransferase with HDIG domain
MNDLKELKSLCKDFRVLYVEDDLEIQKIMHEYLKKFFLHVSVANDGLEGLKFYKKETFDIVITDLSMPNMNGLDMIEKIREINKEQIILITTAHTSSEYMSRAIKYGVDGYIIKPFDFFQLNGELFKIAEKIKKFSQNEEYKNHLQRMIEQKTSELSSMMHFEKHNYDKTLLSMVEMIEDRDTYTAGHSQRVAHYSKLIAIGMNYSKEECDKVYQAGILHDIGKIATPDVILLNPHALNELEYKLIKEHVNVGYRLLHNIPMFKNLAEIVHSHHEHYDGSGYPRGLEGDAITPLARVMMVADAFDAMTTNRIYKGRKTVPQALEELSSLQKIHFFPEVVQSALKVLKDIKIDADINQLPHTAVEEERFAYFYKDILCNAYNENYLDLMLVRNTLEKKLQFMSVISLKSFTGYNEKYGWKAGDNVLKKVAKYLHNNYKESFVFRVYGDDFIILSEEELELSQINLHMDIISKHELKCGVKVLNLSDVDITKIEYLVNNIK